MPDDVPTVRLLQAAPFADGKGRERIVAVLEGGDIAVATRAIGEERAEFEISFNLGEAERLAGLCLSGNSHVLTMPGLTRILCAATIALSRAAFMAGSLQPAHDRAGDGQARGGDDEDGHGD